MVTSGLTSIGFVTDTGEREAQVQTRESFTIREKKEIYLKILSKSECLSNVYDSRTYICGLRVKGGHNCELIPCKQC